MIEKRFNNKAEAERYLLIMKKAFFEPLFKHTITIEYIVRTEGIKTRGNEE